MRRNLLILMLPTLALFVACWPKPGLDEYYDLDEYTFSTLDISTVGGEIDVRSGLSASLDAKFHGAEDAELLEIELIGDMLVVHSLCEDLGCTIDLDFVVPIGTEIIGSTVRGDIYVEEMESGARLYSEDGNVVVMDIEGGVDIVTTTGDVELWDLQDEIWVTTIDGRVEGAALEATSIVIDTAGGKVSLETEIAPFEVLIDTNSGGVDLTVPMAEYNLDLESIGGDVSVYGLDDTDTAERVISIHSASGDISVSGD